MNTLLISLGGNAYPRSPRLRHQAFENSSRAIAGFLKSGGRALVMPEHHLDLFDDFRAWSDQLMVIKDWLERWTDADLATPIENVMVHYVGHGQFRRNSEDHVLTMNSTDADHVVATSASLRDLNEVLKKSAALQRRIYLIDACFAAASTRDLMGALDETVEVEIGGVIGAWQQGVAALCSADKATTADAGGHRGLTQFTDGLLSVLEKGDRGSSGALTLRRVHRLLRMLLAERYKDDAIWPVLVAPDDAGGGIGAVPLFPNLVEAHERDQPEEPFHAATTLRERPIPTSATAFPALSGEEAGSSQRQAGVSILTEAIDEKPSAQSPALGKESDSRTEESLSPDQRFRRATYRFFRLPRSVKADIARMLHVDMPGDASQTDLDRYKAILIRARDTGGVDHLEKLIGKAEQR